MSIATTTHRVSYTGDASTVAFSFPYKYISSADIVVVLVTTATGAETIQTLTTNYTVTGASASNGVYASATITMVTAPTAAQTLVIYRRPSGVNEFDFASESTPLPVVSRFADRVAMQIQQLYNDTVRKSPGSLAAFDVALPNPEGYAGYALGVGSDEGGFTWLGELASVTVSSALEPVVTESTLARAGARLGSPNWYNVKNPTYGATGDGSTDDTAAIHLARTAGGVGAIIYCPAPGTYIVDQLTMNVASQTLYIERGAKLKLKNSATGNAVIIGANNVKIYGEIDGNRSNSNTTRAGITCDTYTGTEIDVKMYDCGAYGVYASDTPGVKIRGKIYDITGIPVFNRILSRTSDMPGPDIDLEVDYSNEPTSQTNPGIVVRGTATYDILDSRVRAKVRMQDDPDDSEGIAVEMWYVRRFTANVQSRGGSMCLSLAEAKQGSGVLDGVHFNYYGLEYADACVDCHFYGVLDGRDESGTDRCLNALAFQGSTGTNTNCHFTGVLRGSTASRLINYSSGSKCSVTGAMFCGTSNYVILDNAQGNFDLHGYYNGETGGDYIALLSGSTGKVRVSGRAEQFDNAGINISASSAITIDYVSMDGLSFIDCNGGGFVSSLSGGAALGEHVTAMGCSGQTYGASTWRADILNFKKVILRVEGNGTPEGTLAAGIGSIFLRNDGGDGTVHYVKVSGSGNTGWESSLPVDGIATTATVTAAAGASNVSTVTVTAKDVASATVTGVQVFEIYTASDSAGTTISTTAYSGSLVATTGKIIQEVLSKHRFIISTDSNGVFVGSLTDTAKTADYIVVRKPHGAGIVVSSAAAYGA